MLYSMLNNLQRNSCYSKYAIYIYNEIIFWTKCMFGGFKVLETLVLTFEIFPTYLQFAMMCMLLIRGNWIITGDCWDVLYRLLLHAQGLTHMTHAVHITCYVLLCWTDHNILQRTTHQTEGSTHVEPVTAAMLWRLV